MVVKWEMYLPRWINEAAKKGSAISCTKGTLLHWAMSLTLEPAGPELMWWTSLVSLSLSQTICKLQSNSWGPYPLLDVVEEQIAKQVKWFSWGADHFFSQGPHAISSPSIGKMAARNRLTIVEQFGYMSWAEQARQSNSMRVLAMVLHIGGDIPQWSSHLGKEWAVSRWREHAWSTWPSHLQ